MSDAEKPQKPTKKYKISPAKELRNAAIKEKALAGKSESAIAREMDLDRSTVHRVLTDEQVKAAVSTIDNRIANLIPLALEALEHHLLNKDYVAARDLLKNFGSMRQQIEMNHTGNFIPCIIEKRDGTVTELTVKPKEEKENKE